MFQIYRGVRALSSSCPQRASFVNVNEKLRKPGQKLTRQETIEKNNMLNQSKLYHIDSDIGIFNSKVTKVLDLGYVPGNWLQFSKFRLCDIHGLEESKIATKCCLLGFDILFGTPPMGTSTIQGNMFSKTAHKSIENHFKDYELKRQLRLRSESQDFQRSYFAKEQADNHVEEEISHLEETLEKTSLIEEFNYKPQVILSDLGSPFLQERGFFNNTNSRPYYRFFSNNALKQPIIDKLKSSFDLADACMVLTCDILEKHGTLVLRLPRISKDDPELLIIKNRLQLIFEEVIEWCIDREAWENIPAGELFFICKNKCDDSADKRKVFAKL